MNQKNEQDFLRNLDWQGVYAEVPESVRAGAQFAFMRIRRREQKRKFVMRSLSAAACIVLMLCVGLFALQRESDAPDIVSQPEISAQILSENDYVFAAQADDYFHIRSDCPAAMAEQVRLQLITAKEFSKEKCSVCGAQVLLPG